MKRPNLSAKRIAVDKTNASLIIIISVAVFLIIFSMVAIKALYSQLTYQSRVINEKKITLDVVEENIEEVDKLNNSYKEFVGSPENVLGGDPKGDGDKDGENPRIILDALPSRYDFPALTASLDKLVNSGGFNLTAISGTDEEVKQSENDSSETPEPIEMPFNLEAEIGLDSGKKFLELFERSIRPIHIQKLSITGQENNLRITISAETFFQPEKKLNITNEVVK